MAFTTHWHHIAGTDITERPTNQLVARCGGPGVCQRCTSEAYLVLLATMSDQREDVKEAPEKIDVPRYVPSEILRYFQYERLDEAPRLVSHKFWLLASRIDEQIPNSAEKSVALRKLLEAKDAAVRAALDL